MCREIAVERNSRARGRREKKLAIPKSWRLTTGIVLTALVIALTIVPGNPQPGDSAFVWAIELTPAAVQKLMHVVLYALLFAVWYWTFGVRRSPGLTTTACAIALIALGAVLEFVQLSIPGRFGTLIDVSLNTGGVAIGIALTTITGNSGRCFSKARSD